MVELSEDFYETLELLRKHCTNALHLLKQVERGVVGIRSDMTKSFEALLFVEAYETITHSRFSMYNSKTGLNRVHFKKEWVCQHSLLNKKSVTSAEKCAAKICIAVKKITKLSRATDGYLKLEPPLQAVIKITLHHNHQISTKLTDLLSIKMPRISGDVRETFFEYFRKGINGVKAKRLHEKNLREKNITALDDASLNPCMSSVYRLYKKWKQLKENDLVIQVSIPDSGSAWHFADDKKQTLFDSNGTSNVHNIASNYGSRKADQVEGLEHGTDNSNVNSSIEIKEEIIEDENEVVSQLPIIVSCRTLAPEAYSILVPDKTRKVLPSASKSVEVPTAKDQPGPSEANNVMVQNSRVVPTNVSVLRVEPVKKAQLYYYNESSNTLQVVESLKIYSPTSASIQSSDQYNLYFAKQIQLPSRVGVQKL